MRIALHLALSLSAGLLLTCGCASYKFRSSVPEELRTMAVPVFENASGYPEIDAVVTQYVLREFQREGTFKICPIENPANKPKKSSGSRANSARKRKTP